jgi:hypothetical protein
MIDFVFDIVDVSEIETGVSDSDRGPAGDVVFGRTSALYLPRPSGRKRRGHGLTFRVILDEDWWQAKQIWENAILH